MSTRLFLARHGQTAWNVKSRYMGQVDVPLDETGERQAALLGHRLAEEGLAAIYTSDLLRARQTAIAIAAHQTCPLIPEARLREMDFGVWQGLTYAEIQETNRINLEAWEADRLRNTPPGGESLSQFSSRVEAAYQEIIQAHLEETTLVVAHGGVMKILLCLVLGLPPERYWQIQISPASLSEIWIYPEGGSLNLLNDACHLREEV
jgi:alpha-ribazole phosphatase